MKFRVERIPDGGSDIGGHIIDEDRLAFVCPQQVAVVKFTITFADGETQESCICSREEASVFAQALVEVTCDA